MTGLALAATFAFGVLVGFIGCLAWQQNRRPPRRDEARVHRVRQTRPVPYSQARRVGLIAVALTVFLNALSGLLVVRNGIADGHRTDCTVEQNRIDGEARDARNDAAETSTDTELAFLRSLKSQAENPPPADQQLPAFLATVQARIDSLRGVKSARNGNRYTTPDACADGHITEEERVGR